MKFRNVSLPQIETDLELCQVFEPQSRTPSPLYERIIGNFRTIVRFLIWDVLSLARVQLFEAGNEGSFCRPLGMIYTILTTYQCTNIYSYGLLEIT